jgi:hypothetical protein
LSQLSTAVRSLLAIARRYRDRIGTSTADHWAMLDRPSQ